jgi:hypothetical protein
VAITWDTPGERRYEAGVDRGVLYPHGGVPVAWNGLIGVTQSDDSDLNETYIDGVKVFDYHRAGAFKGKIKAFTYPDALDGLTGAPEGFTGVHIHDQQARRFNLSWRTLLGTDTVGLAHYKVHVVYNILAKPGEIAFETISEDSDPQTFEWEMMATPIHFVNKRPICHISFDSRRIDPGLLPIVEASLYSGLSSEPLNDYGGLVAFLEWMFP